MMNKKHFKNLKIVKGNLLESDCNIIIQQCNCFTTMGAGIAKQIKKLYPKAYTADINFHIPSGDKKRLGKYSFSKENNKMIINLYSQFKYGTYTRQTDYSAMEKALNKLLKDYPEITKQKIGFPYLIGAGLAGGNEKIILQLLNNIAYNHKTTFYLYKLK